MSPKNIKFIVLTALLVLQLSKLSGAENPIEVTAYMPYYRLPLTSENYQEAFDFSAQENSLQNQYTILEETRLTKQLKDYIQMAVARNVVGTINYFRLLPSASGGLDTSGIVEQQLVYLNKLKDIYDFKLNITVAGGASSYISMLKSPEKTTRFIQELARFVRKWELDAVDYDWEFPRNEKDLSNYVGLIKATKTELQDRATRVSIAIARKQLLSKELLDAADFIHFMSYDFAGRHSTYNSSVEMVEYLMARYEIAPEKIFLGIPFYGRVFDVKQKAYRDPKTYRYIVRNFAVDEDKDEASTYYFNNKNLIAKKIQYAKNKNLGGIMIWELGQDVFDSRSLLRAIN